MRSYFDANNKRRALCNKKRKAFKFLIPPLIKLGLKLTFSQTTKYKSEPVQKQRPCGSEAERALGKGEVMSSNLIMGATSCHILDPTPADCRFLGKNFQ